MNALGASYTPDGTAVVFSVVSSQATRLEAWIYADGADPSERLRIPMSLSPGNSMVFETTVTVTALTAAGVTGVVFYGYRAWGPNWNYNLAWTPGSALGFVYDCDAMGNRFNPNKLLLDPYAREVAHDPLTLTHPDPSGYMSGAANRYVDTAPFAPRGVVLPLVPAAAARRPAAPQHAFKDDIIYEVNVRGLTMNDPSVQANLRGTYAGAATKAASLQALGITAIELLPVPQMQNETNDALPLSTSNMNYWGYEPFGFFAPDRRYALDQTPGGPTSEFRGMVDAFHAVGIKVYCDFVFNHGGEGDVDVLTGAQGRIFTCRGLDNATYYEVQDRNDRYAGVPSQIPFVNSPGHFYRNDNGVSGNLNCANPIVRNLIIDALKYWHNDLGVDGFRFDLAELLGNTQTRNGFSFSATDTNNALNRAVAELPARPAAGGPGVDLIAEPYTAGTDFQLGHFPNGWAEWNTMFRDTFRTSQNKLGIQDVTPGQMATRFAGSQDLFGSRTPSASINFITCHDGFALRDLYSFTQTQNNQTFPFGPSSGGRSAWDEICWDQGGLADLQRQADRNGLAIVLLSTGVPMFCGGDEFYRTQYGNNNMFNVDTDKNWLDYTAGAMFGLQTEFTQNLIAFRNAHVCLRPLNFFTGADHNGNGLKDLTWYDDSGNEVSQAYFADPMRHYLSYRIDGSEFGDVSPSVLVLYNGGAGDIAVHLPGNLPGQRWYVIGDTSSLLSAANNFLTAGAGRLVFNLTYLIKGRSVVVLIEGA